MRALIMSILAVLVPVALAAGPSIQKRFIGSWKLIGRFQPPRTQGTMNVDYCIDTASSYFFGDHESSQSWRPLRSWRFPIPGAIC